eukprot:scaffold1790_cov257-Pinguiococcus_pyrenoidosus.AAC.36
MATSAGICARCRPRGVSSKLDSVWKLMEATLMSWLSAAERSAPSLASRLSAASMADRAGGSRVLRRNW